MSALVPNDPTDTRCMATRPLPGADQVTSPLYGARERCKATAVLYATQRKPGPNGQRGMMKLCDACWQILVAQLGADYATAQKIDKP